jgi:hypothetical protein
LGSGFQRSAFSRQPKLFLADRCPQAFSGQLSAVSQTFAAKMVALGIFLADR